MLEKKIDEFLKDCGELRKEKEILNFINICF